MKKRVSVSATDYRGTKVTLVGIIDTGKQGRMARTEVAQLADDMRDRLMLVMPELPRTAFRLANVAAK